MSNMVFFAFLQKKRGQNILLFKKLDCHFQNIGGHDVNSSHLRAMFELDSFTGYQSSPIRYSPDSMPGFEAVVEESPKGSDFPLFKIEPVPLEWDAVDDLTSSEIFNEQIFGALKTADLRTKDGMMSEAQKRIQKKHKTPQQRRKTMTVFKPFESAESTELTVKRLRIWLDNRAPLEQISSLDFMTAAAMGF